MYAGLAATTGDTLLQGQTFQYFYINFSTGSGLGHSTPGAPIVTTVTKSNEYGCFGVVVQFNETLAYQPTIRIHYRPGTLKDKIDVWPYPQPVLPYDNSVWRADLCDSSIAIFSDISVYIDDFVDLDEGNHGCDGTLNTTTNVCQENEHKFTYSF